MPHAGGVCFNISSSLQSLNLADFFFLQVYCSAHCKLMRRISWISIVHIDDYRQRDLESRISNANINDRINSIKKKENLAAFEPTGETEEKRGGKYLNN